MPAVRPTFVNPCVPTFAKAPPTGEVWVHQPKLDGFRCIVVKNGARVRVYSRRGVQFRLPGMAAALTNLGAETAVIDGELICVGADGRANFYGLMRQMRSSNLDESALQVMAFGLLFQDGVDLRGLPLSERLRDLGRLLRKVRLPCAKLIESFPDGGVLFDHCNRLHIDGVVSKRLDARYTSGPSRTWLKIKCESWRRDNEHRHKLFEGYKKPKPAPTEREKALERKRVELGRVRASLERPGLRPGLAAAFKAQETALLQEIAEIEAETQ